MVREHLPGPLAPFSSWELPGRHALRELEDPADDPETGPRDQNSREPLRSSRAVCPSRRVVCAEMTHRITGAAVRARARARSQSGCDWAEGSVAARGLTGLAEFGAGLVESQPRGSPSPGRGASQHSGGQTVRSATRRWTPALCSCSLLSAPPPPPTEASRSAACALPASFVGTSAPLTHRPSSAASLSVSSGANRVSQPQPWPSW